MPRANYHDIACSYSNTSKLSKNVEVNGCFRDMAANIDCGDSSSYGSGKARANAAEFFSTEEILKRAADCKTYHMGIKWP